MKIYVGNLPFDCDSTRLSELFAPHGEVISAQIVTDRDTGRSRGFGFVEMDDTQAKAAIDALEGKELGGRTLTVNEARPRVDGSRRRPPLVGSPLTPRRWSPRPATRPTSSSSSAAAPAATPPRCTAPRPVSTWG